MTPTYNQIRRILCPFDFNANSRSGLEYAGRLAQALNATLTVFYVRTSLLPDEPQLYEDQNDTCKGIKRQLQIEAGQIAAKYDIPCDISIESTTATSDFTIGEASAAYELTVMGTTGADDLYEHIFGNGTHHRIGLTKCPVLLVPEGYMPRVPELIMYAVDPGTSPTHILGDLETLTSPLNAEIRQLYLIPEPGLVQEGSGTEFSEAMIGVHGRWGFDWDLNPINSDEVVEALDGYMKQNKGHLLALSCHHRALFEGLFQESVIAEFNSMATYPILVFWH